MMAEEKLKISEYEKLKTEKSWDDFPEAIGR